MIDIDAPRTASITPKRIVFVAPFGLGEKTTVWARTLPLARQLVDHGYTVTIVIPPWDTPADSGRSWQDGSVQIINVALRGGLLLVLWRMMCTLTRLRPDIVHIVKPRAHAGLVQWWLWQRRRLRGKGPLILLDVDDWEQAWAEVNNYPPLVARFLAWQEEWGIRHADGITAASHWLVERVNAYAPATPLCYLPNAVTPPNNIAPADFRSADFASADITSTQRAGAQILFYSRYVEVSPEWLATFWNVLHALQPDATLVVFGDALQVGRTLQFQQTMTELASAAATAVCWQPYRPDLVDALYRSSACAIFPSLPGPLLEAKCSVKLATTMLQGVPVVASAVGEQQYYGANGAATLVPPSATPAEFAEIVAQVLATPRHHRRQQANALERLLQRYDRRTLGQTLAAFYQPLLEH
ncbi:MAG TPA: glycosyltransferase family 4 protein [Caldilineaceae bacterium]|nr:glycosyltransferase family 4 protein [Caldilineaceae bacterium]